MLVALEFRPGRDGEPVSALRSGKVVLLDRHAIRPRAFPGAPKTVWVCDIVERDRFAIARVLKVAAEWPYRPKAGPGPYFSSSLRLPGGSMEPCPPVDGLVDKTDPEAEACAVRLRANSIETSLWYRLVREFGQPEMAESTFPTQGTWATPWGPLTLQVTADQSSSAVTPDWEWTGEWVEEGDRLMGRRVCGAHESWGVACVAGHPPKRGLNDVFVRRWADAHLPNPHTCPLEGEGVEWLVGALRTLYDLGVPAMAQVWLVTWDSEDKWYGGSHLRAYLRATPGDVPLDYRFLRDGPALALAMEAKAAKASRDEILAAMLLGLAMGDTARAWSDEARAVALARAQAMLPPRLDRREDHPRWSDIARCDTEAEALRLAWQAAERDAKRICREHPEVKDGPAMTPAPSWPQVTKTEGIDRPWLAAEANLEEMRRGLAAAKAALAAWPAAVRAAEEAETLAHGAPAPAAWFLDGITADQVLEMAPMLSPGMGIRAAERLAPGPHPLVWVRRDYAGGSRWRVEAEIVHGLVVVYDASGKRSSHSPRAPKYAVDLLCATTAPDWKVIVRTFKDGELVREETVDGAV